jgi:hypothetical protein
MKCFAKQMSDIRVFLSHTSDLDVPSDGTASLVVGAIRTIAALPGFSVEEQTTTFTAEDQTSAEMCRRRLKGCDVYVGIIGHARGTVVEDDPLGRSFVEFEFDVAREFGLPRIVLVLDAVPQNAAQIAPSQSEFRARLATTQEIVFARVADRGELQRALERALVKFQPGTPEHMSCHVEWAAPDELRSLGVDPCEHRWAVYVRNASDYPAYKVTTLVRSNNGGQDFEIDMGTLAAHDVTTTPYVLNLERENFDPDGDRPTVEMSFTMAGIRWCRRQDGSLSRIASRRKRD